LDEQEDAPVAGTGLLARVKPVGGAQALEGDFLLAQQAVGGFQFAPRTRLLWQATIRVGRKLLSETRGSFVRSIISEVDGSPLLGCPPPNLIRVLEIQPLFYELYRDVGNDKLSR